MILMNYIGLRLKHMPIYTVKRKNLDSIIVQLTYYNVEDFGTKFLRKEYSFHELREFFYDLIEKYKEWILLEKKWIDFRNDSIESFNFPF